jgi:hypothetical protein
MKAELEEKKQADICLLMDEATIIPHPETGRPACKYPVFTTSSPHHIQKTWFTQELPLLSDETPSLQYRSLMNDTGAVGKQKVLAMVFILFLKITILKMAMFLLVIL